MAWKSPTYVREESGYPWGVWDTTNRGDGHVYEAACDDDTGTYIAAPSQSGWTDEELEAHYSGGLWCSKVRVYLQSQAAYQIDIDAYYDGGWHNVYNGSTTEGSWETYWLPKIANVSQIRIKLYSSHRYTTTHKVNEIDFWEVEEDVPTYENCVAAYKLNDNLANTDVLDSSGNGHDGSLQGGDNTVDISATGKINDGFEFTGSNERVNINKDVITGLPFSFAFWANPDEVTAYNWLFVDGDESSYDYSNFLLYIHTTGDRLRFYTSAGNIAIYDNFDEGGWHHVVLTVDGSGNLTAYVDGVEVTTASGMSFSGLTYGLMIGNRSSLDRDYEGLLDALMIFDKELTANEVAWLYNQGAGREVAAYIPSKGTITIQPPMTATLTVQPPMTGKITLGE